MITESLMIFLTTVMSLNTPTIQTNVKNSTVKSQKQTVNTSVNNRGGWDHN
jgi:hypothetical protein